MKKKVKGGNDSISHERKQLLKKLRLRNEIAYEAFLAGLTPEEILKRKKRCNQ